MSIHGPSALLVVSRQLPSECRDRLRLVLRGLTVLSKEPSLVRRGQWLKPRWQRGAGERRPLGLAGLWQQRQLLPALLPPASAARVPQAALGAAAVHGFTAQPRLAHRLEEYVASINAWWSSWLMQMQRWSG